MVITSCQATFQNNSQLEDKVTALEENIHECYAEITKSSDEITSAVRDEYISKSTWSKFKRTLKPE